MPAINEIAFIIWAKLAGDGDRITDLYHLSVMIIYFPEHAQPFTSMKIVMHFAFPIASRVLLEGGLNIERAVEMSLRVDWRSSWTAFACTATVPIRSRWGFPVGHQRQPVVRSQTTIQR